LSKEVIIVAGGNGVGKTTFAREFLLENPDYEFLNADEIAKELSPDNPQSSKISAGKLFFKNLDKYVRDGKSFLIESTLSGRYLIKFIEDLQRQHYRITIMFLFVDSPKILIERVRNRVSKSGHFIPDEDVKRRFKRGKHNFWNIYKASVESWNLFYNASDGFRKIAASDETGTAVIEEDLFNVFLSI